MLKGFDFDNHDRQVVTAAVGPRTRFLDQKLGSLAGGECGEHGAQFAIVEVVPNSVAACHEYITSPELRDKVKIDGWIVISTEAAHQDI